MQNNEAEEKPQQADGRCLLPGLIGKIPLETVTDPPLRDGLAYWRNLRRGRRFPVRSDVTLRGLKSLMRNTILIRVIGEAEDYEYRFVGDAHVVAHGGTTIQGKRWSELDKDGGIFSKQRRQHYDEVVRTGDPVAFGGLVARHFFDPGAVADRVFLQCRTVCLPLGRSEETIDHILTFTVYCIPGARRP
jgi:hypothetical protein